MRQEDRSVRPTCTRCYEWRRREVLCSRSSMMAVNSSNTAWLKAGCESVESVHWRSMAGNREGGFA